MKSRKLESEVMVAGVILAGGRSARMGRPKALLRQTFSHDTFVGHLIRASRIAGLNPIFVVGRSARDDVAAEVNRHGAIPLVNGDADRGQLSSILVGLEAAEAIDASGILVMPVDVPLLSAQVLSAVLAAAETSEAQIVRATHAGRHGHPVLFKPEVFDELRAADPMIGARAVVRADPSRIRDVEVDEAGVTMDVDTPEDYRRLFGRDP
jgi:molybdenum cofactor cytidylyltransferase